MIDEAKFDKIADEELRELERRLGEIDPDEVEVDLASGVLTLTLPQGGTVVINSHRAAGQIWMAAFRKAWHFDPKPEGAGWKWRTASDELHEALSQALSAKLGRPIVV